MRKNMTYKIMVVATLITVLMVGGSALAQTDKSSNVLAVARHEDGIICDYLASEKPGAPGVVSVRMDRRDFNFLNGLQTQEQYDQLSQLPVGSRIKFDFSVLGDPVDQTDEAAKGGEISQGAGWGTNVVIDKLHSVADPDPSLCRALTE
jgi:hypothetical protein